MTGTSTTGAALPTGTSDAGLANVAVAAGKKYFGSATDNPELTDTAYVAQLSNTNDFLQITPVRSRFDYNPRRLINFNTGQ